jgi:SAM-dependent methyltransferase
MQRMKRDKTAEAREALAPSGLKTYTESNRQAWNEVTPLHQKAAKAKWDSAFSRAGFVRLPGVQLDLLKGIGIAGKSVAHLCCNNGIELLSLKNLGAGLCVGFDISDEAVKEAQERAQRCGIDCRFVRTDVYDIGAEYDNWFDMVYITVGCLGWLPDLNRFTARAAALLRDRGCIFMHEIHPFYEMLPFDNDAVGDPLRIVGPYFKPAPYIEYGGLDYLGNVDYPSAAAQYWFVHTMSDIITSLIACGLSLEHFREYEAAITPHQRPIEQLKAGVPLSYTLVARKQSRASAGCPNGDAS